MKFSDLNQLPDVLEFSGEFGSELVLFLPFMNWLSATGLLKNRKILTYQGMRTFYDELDSAGTIYKNEMRTYLAPRQRSSWLPVKDEHNFDKYERNPFHLFPDFRAKYGNTNILIEKPIRKPLLLIHNKYNIEWDKGPINFIPTITLEEIFNKLSEKFQIIYARHRGQLISNDFSADHNKIIEFDDDFKLIKNYPEIINFDSLYELNHRHTGVDFNHFKNALLAKTFYFISSQGGGAHHLAMFSGSAIAIYHKEGDEIKWAYENGYYNFMAPISPNLTICQNSEELLGACNNFTSSSIRGGRVNFMRY